MKDKEIFEILLSELESNFLEVMLSPAPEQKHTDHFVRVTVMKNAKWYSELCGQYPSSRRDNYNGKRTLIKRANIIGLLKRLIENKPTNSKYLFDLEKIKNEKAKELQDWNFRHRNRPVQEG